VHRAYLEDDQLGKKYCMLKCRTTTTLKSLEGENVVRNTSVTTAMLRATINYFL